MKQQLSGTKGIVIGDISVRIGADMDIQQEGLSIADDSKESLRLALPSRMDLTSVPRRATPASNVSSRK